MPDEAERLEFLTTLHWEASRAGVDPQLMLGLIQVESGFRKYAVSPVGARGYTQVMPFWVKAIGNPDHNLFQLRTNLRYGALILRHYIDIERGDLVPRTGPLQRQPGTPGISQPRRRRMETPLGLDPQAPNRQTRLSLHAANQNSHPTRNPPPPPPPGLPRRRLLARSRYTPAGCTFNQPASHRHGDHAHPHPCGRGLARDLHD